MARGKLQLKKIQNPVKRRVTFSKRKAGLLKKASELSLLCDAEVALIIFSPKGNLFEFANTSMNRIMGKYQNILSSTGHQIQVSENIETLRLEVENLEKRMAHLERANKHMTGEDLDSLSFKHLRYLEKKTILGVRKIRSRKDKISFERMASLKIKEQSLKKENANLDKKEINIETNRVKGNMEADAATQQDLPKAKLNLWFLTNEVDRGKEVVEDQRKEWRKYGYTILSDGWTDDKNRTIIIFFGCLQEQCGVLEIGGCLQQVEKCCDFDFNIGANCHGGGS
ncbi:truncated transcription factor CAULIFLOWER A isoform X3 [Cryptomeria japonica]|uniref:truncated transcription factor CAULIFLOWER A isoform X3 n=1 Tax=Cryptomeria japonica TaxID=3369 RepID=UPI0025AC2D5E|nr:truncated transcription factor CAULIFLOWER A isoform X3 [Cryptomeria japonica]